MSQLRPGRIVTVILTALAVAGMYNVFADNSAVDRLASESAPICKGGCPPTRFTRTPLWHDYTLTNRQGATAEVRCTRAFWLVGEMHCGPH